ncbi:tetratricopeptide repeat protein [Methylobacterium sp. A54F]
MLRNTRHPSPVAAAPGPHKLFRRALAHHEAGRLRDAEAQYLRFLEVSPGDAAAHYRLGLIASARHDSAQAVPHLAAALKGAPGEPQHWLALIVALLAADRLGDARAILARFLAQGFSDAVMAPIRAQLCDTLEAEAQIHYEAGEFLRAEPFLDTVILLDASRTEAVHLAGAIAAQTNRLQQAFDLVSIAIHRDDAQAAYFSNLGSILSRQGDLSAAMQAFERALAIDPTRALTHSNLAGVLQRQGRHTLALEALGRAVAADPTFANAHSNLGVVLKDLGRLEEAIAAFDEALRLDPSLAFVHSNRLFAKLYAAEVAPEAYYADAAAFGRRFGDPALRTRPFANARDPDRRLRVGFVSADLREHAVTYFFEPFLRHFDGAAFETVAYANSEAEDATTLRLKGMFAHWRNIVGHSDDAVADLIERDRIDILVDLSGHSAGNRLLVFARKPAPVQVTWIGHPGTTGLRAMDYRLTDANFEPEGSTDHLHTETLWRLPHVSGCYEAHPLMPPVIDHPPCRDNGYVTFGCFNRFTKVSDDALAVWASILRQVPDARILFEIVGIHDPVTRAGALERLARAGLPIERVDLEARTPKTRYVLYNRIDIALDPFPYNGGTTSLDTLYLGVPFVTLEGRHTAGRMGQAILRAAGLPELVADSPEAYVAIAAGLAHDRDRLAALRDGLQGRMAASPLMDHAALAADVGTAFRGMWRRWLAA